MDEHVDRRGKWRRPDTLPPGVRDVVDATLERVRSNLGAGLPLTHGADPFAVCVRLGVPIDHSPIAKRVTD